METILMFQKVTLIITNLGLQNFTLGKAVQD